MSRKTAGQQHIKKKQEADKPARKREDKLNRTRENETLVQTIRKVRHKEVKLNMKKKD